METTVKQFPFGKTGDGHETVLYRICHENGTYVEVLNYGCTLRGMGVFERGHRLRNVIAGPKDAAACEMTDIPGGIRITGAAPDAVKELEHSVWQTQEIGQNFVLFCAKSKEYGFSAAVKIRLMDHQRLVLDYMAAAEKASDYGITHSVPFRLCELDRQRQQKARIFCPACANGETLDQRGFSSVHYTGIEEAADVRFVSEGGQIHPMVELLAEETELALSAYSTMPDMRLRAVDRTVHAVELTALPGENTPRGKDAVWSDRTVFGVDLVYRPDMAAGSPFASLMR